MRLFVRRIPAVAVLMLAATAGPALASGVPGPNPPEARCGAWMDPHQPPSRRAGELLSAMTTSQKLSMLHQAVGDGTYFGAAGYVPGIPSLCIPPLTLNDAGSGLADEQTDVTSYPAEIDMAASWNPTLARAVGSSLGGEARRKGIDVLLAPDVNITRTPLGGRTSEQLGEDPYLSGQLAAAYIRGVQSRHVIATVKQYDANTQEVDRASIDEQIPQRALAEIYQPAFAAAIKQGGAASVMCAYNQVNGSYSCQNKQLLADTLEHGMGFKGFVMSDWGATHSTVGSVKAGLDLEMGVIQDPTGRSFSPGGTEVAEDWYGQPLEAAVAAGKVTMSEINGMVGRILTAMFSVGLFDHPPAPQPAAYATPANGPAARAVALKAAEEGTVLLENRRGTLPLTGADRTIALIGAPAGPAALSYDEAGGSVHVLQSSISTPLSAITARAARAGDTVVYNDGSSPAAAAALARTASVAVVFAGYVESEGSDLSSLGYTQGVCELECVTQPADTNQLISAVAAANPRTVVVLDTGGPALMPWLNQVASVVEAWYPGQEDGAAAAAVLFGDVDPSGKLPVTFPASVAQGPLRTAAQYPGVNGTMSYSEGLLVGYRWYDAERLTPLFPFGFGLSYTSFAFSGLRVTGDGPDYVVSYTITNTGHRAGADVGQVYISDPPATGEPPQQLKGFSRTVLAPGQSRLVSVSLGPSAFSVYSTTARRWVEPPGCYTVGVGDSSRHEPLTARVPVAGGRC